MRKIVGIFEEKSKSVKIDVDAQGALREKQGFRESAYFRNVLIRDLTRAEEQLNQIRTSNTRKFKVPYGKAIIARFAMYDMYAAMVAAYTGGYPFKLLAQIFTRIVESSTDVNSIYLNRPDNPRSESILDIRLDSAMTLSLISLGICLRLDTELMRRFIALTGPGGIIRVYDRLAQVFVPDRKLAPEDSGGIYRKLSDLIDLPKTAEGKQFTQGKALRTYVNSWYNNTRGDGWHDSHKDTNDTRYRGYWTFEAAGVAAAFDLDDSLCRDSPYYPADLVDFYRGALRE